MLCPLRPSSSKKKKPAIPLEDSTLFVVKGISTCDADGIDVELVPKFVEVAKFLSNMIPARQRRLSHLLRNSPRANANVAGMAVLVDADIQPGDDG